MNIHYQADPTLIRYRKVAVIGYGSQGHAHALNLKDSGVDVVVGLRSNSPSIQQAQEEGLEVYSVAGAAEWADVVVLLVPDQHHRKVYEADIVRHLTPEKALAVGHGFSIHYGEIEPPEGVDVFMVAPKSPGHLVRRTYQEGQGVPCLAAVAQDATGDAKALALSYADAIGGTRAGVIETTFKDETETDLFGEQAVLCGGSEALIKAGFETLVEAGYPAELAYFECLHELKLIVDLYYEGGLSYMNYSVSETAEYGGYSRGPRVVDDGVKDRMKQILDEVQSGAFAREWLAECADGAPTLAERRAETKDHLIEHVGRRLRKMMSWVRSGERGDGSVKEVHAEAATAA